MFSKKLSISILGICDSQGLTYETASELCDLSPRYFGSIARGKTSPSIDTLEKLCIAFDRSPNELLRYTPREEDLSYRTAAQVTRYRVHRLLNGNFTTFPVCPNCINNIEREYQSFCSRCGQKLLWDFYHYATLLTEKE